MNIKKRICIPLLSLSLITSGIVANAEISGDDAFGDLSWNLLAEHPLSSEGVVQSVCATEDYIICIENISEDPAVADIVTAYYKNKKDADGNPVEQYSLAKTVADTSWEHGNGMTYNPNTHEIYVALYTSSSAENRGCIYVMDPDTLEFVRSIKISDDYNILGIAYKEETNQYIIQTNIEDSYSFKVLDENFKLVEDLGEYESTAKGDNNFQDMEVCGDYILNFPLTLFSGVGDYLHVYSISKKEMIADPAIDFQFEGVASDEPESICQIRPGDFLSVVTTVANDGARSVRFYETKIPYYFNMAITDENGNTIHEEKVLRGTDYEVPFEADDGFELASLQLDGKDVDLSDSSDSYTVKDVNSDHQIQISYQKSSMMTKILPAYKKGKSSFGILGMILGLLAVGGIGIGAYAFYVKLERERRRKIAIARRKRRMSYEETEANDIDDIELNRIIKSSDKDNKDTIHIA